MKNICKMGYEREKNTKYLILLKTGVSIVYISRRIYKTDVMSSLDSSKWYIVL